MGKTIGELAGFAMLLLIWILFLNMLGELKLIKREKVLLTGKVSLSVWGAGIVYLVLGGFFYNISVDRTGIFQYDIIWGYGSYGQIMNQVESGSVQGIVSMIYLMIARGVGTVFFKQYISGAIYTSFLFAIVCGTLLYFLLRESLGSKWAEKLLLLMLGFPFSYRLFLPSPVSMVCCLAVMIAGGLIYACRSFRRPVIVCKISDWLYYFLLCAFLSVNIMFYYNEILLRQ